MTESDKILEEAARLKAAHRPFVLVTVVRCESPTSAKPGAKAVVGPDGVIQGWIGGGCAQPTVIKMARQALKGGQPRLIRISPSKSVDIDEGILDFGMTCHSGGTLDIFIDPIIPRPVLLIVGASPAAQALSTLAPRVGFSVIAAFPGADRELFPDAEQIVDGLDVAEHLSCKPSFVVVATQGKRDEQGLEAALNSGADFIAFVASERKAKKLKSYLKERGHDGERVDAILSPAGIEIGAITPEEVALSVLAGLVRERRQLGHGETTSGHGEKKMHEDTGCCGTAQEQEKPAPEPDCCSCSSQGNADHVDPVCGMSVASSEAEYHTEYAGNEYYFCCAACQQSFEKEPDRYLEESRGRK